MKVGLCENVFPIIPNLKIDRSDPDQILIDFFANLKIGIPHLFRLKISGNKIQAAEIRKWMESAEGRETLAGITSLNLSDSNLLELPPEIALLSQLQLFNCSGNHLSQLPKEMEELHHLIDLDCSKNDFFKFPSVHHLKRLEKLNCSKNQISFLPPHEIEQLTALKDLDISSNDLTMLPDELGNCPLERLSCRFNHLRTIPSSLNILTLREVDLAFNGLRFLPSDLFHSLPQLEIVRLNGNFSVLPLVDISQFRKEVTVELETGPRRNSDCCAVEARESSSLFFESSVSEEGEDVKV